MSVPVALAIAGSDSGAGAGVQADLKTFAALGIYGTSVITALTAQNTKGVSAIHQVPSEFIAEQIEAVFSDFAITAVKIGMLGNAEAIGAVREGLKRHNARHVVLDPVLAASSGEKLLRDGAMSALRDLIARVDVLTPNIPEAAALLGASPARDESEMQAQAENLLTLGVRAVLLKGGHGTGSESVDLLVTPDGCERFAAPRIATKNTHGTGCTFASAVAAGLAKGQKLADAVGEAKAYVNVAIAEADRLGVGSGRGSLHHFAKWW
ncbi:MAG TPA: bifunctional hydroxymethylpyrimidine kinase/phosphomethylpyrimidine kinase [Xanthobacteraceae bacterium]|jgi:hydroxymethylpyrimidine/phosphomethylpyrimidine kinase|nr:bifunctional hydroxymethylpyrimidine kinase/phosphomethylpyrimidine kinase [Xanthobacteraceae bacterium]